MLNFFNSVLYETIITENESEKQVLTIVRLHYILGVSDVKRSLPGELIVNETIDEYFDLVEVYKRLDQYDQELVWALLQEIRKTAEKRKRNEKDAEDSHM